jgi:archaellin
VNHQNVKITAWRFCHPLLLLEASPTKKRKKTSSNQALLVKTPSYNQIFKTDNNCITRYLYYSGGLFIEEIRDIMDDQAKLGTIAGILLLLFILIGAVSASVIITNTQITSEDDLNSITNEIVDELCSYLQIKQIIGKYQIIQGQQRINKIAILIKPFVSQNIDISKMTIELCDGDQYKILFFNGTAGSIRSHSLFEHPLWDSMANETFGLLSTIDDDNSIINSHLINKNTDMAFIILKLPDENAMNKDDLLDVTILPSPGIGRTVTLEAPLPIKNVVTLY